MGAYLEKFQALKIGTKIRNILNEIEIPKSMGVIVRTAGANKTKNEMKKIFKILLRRGIKLRVKRLSQAHHR